MNKIYSHLINEESTIKKSTIWYTMGSFCNTGSSVLLLMYVSRVLDTRAAGVFSIDWAIAQLMLTVGWFNTRNYQVSDIKGKYEFRDYLTLKLVTSFIAVAGGIVYSIAIGNYGYKLLVTFLLCTMFVSDIFADCFSGFFQQQEKLHIAGKSSVARICLYNLTFLITLILFRSLPISIVSAFIVSGTWVLIFDYQIAKRITTVKFSFKPKTTLSLIKDCFPLFFGNFLTVFLVNIPKNTINRLYESDVQALYNIIFMPSSVTNMFCMFIFVPLFTSVTKKWYENRVENYIKSIGRVLLMVVAINVFVLVCGYFLGVPLLSMFYGVDVSNLKTPMMILLLAGGFGSANNVLSFSTTVMRKQQYITFGYIAALIITYMSSSYLVQEYELLGASLTYLIGISIVTISLIIINVTFIYLRYRNEKLYGDKNV
jgi:O-antigen/teichoic acid export membrane protein